MKRDQLAFWDDEEAKRHPRFAHCMGGYSRRGKGFSLSFLDCDQTIPVIPGTGNTILRRYEATFNRTVAAAQMARWMSRAVLDILDIRAVRLQDLTDADGLAAGMYRHEEPYSFDPADPRRVVTYHEWYGKRHGFKTLREALIDSWERHNRWNLKAVQSGGGVTHYLRFASEPYAFQSNPDEYNAHRGKPVITYDNPLLWAINVKATEQIGSAANESIKP